MRSNGRQALQKLIEQNDREIGRYFRSLLRSNLGTWQRRVLSLLSRSRAYRENDLPGLVELASHLRGIDQIQIEFVEKYLDDLFLPGADSIEKEEKRFLEKKIIPHLRMLMDADRLKGS